MEKRYEIVDKIIAIELYLYIIFMFITKGEGIRNVLLFSSFLLWLATLKYRQNIWILKQPVSLLFWGNIASIAAAVIFSIDPLYSFYSLNGGPLRAIIIFCLVSTMFPYEKRLKRFIVISYLLLVFTLSVGYYSYWAYDLPLMKPLTAIRHAWHARFAIDINTHLPFTLILLLMVKDKRLKIVFLVTMLLGFMAILLSTSRGGLAGFIGMAIVWLIYFLPSKKTNMKITVAGFMIIIIFFGTALLSSPLMREKFIHNKENIMSLGRRTEIWGPLIAAAIQRPLSGWGYGSEIFTNDVPFKDTPYNEAPVHIDPAFRNPHNPFLRILFHQGIPGVILYVVLLFTAITTFWKVSKETGHLKSYMLVACSGILIGTYVVNAMVENSHLSEVAFILGLGLAAQNMKYEDSHN
jgi:O-antigen ligase